MSTDEAAPPFRFTRESRIRIDADGRVWHEGERVAHPRLERALASWVDFDDDARRYVLRNALDWCFVTVDLAPLVVRHAWVRGGGVEVECSDDSREALRVDTVHVRPDGEVFAYVRGGALLARFDRSAAFALLDHVELTPDGAPALRLERGLVPLRTMRADERLAPRPGGPAALAAPST